MWIMGVSLAISMQSQLRNSKPRSAIVINVIRRSVILFGLGLIINSIGGNNDFRTMRIPGVLQRFGISYFIVGIIQAAIASEELPRLNSETNDVPWWWCIRDVKACMGQWMVMLILLVLYLYLTLFMPVPGECFLNFITLCYNVGNFFTKYFASIFKQVVLLDILVLEGWQIMDNIRIALEEVPDTLTSWCLAGIIFTNIPLPNVFMKHWNLLILKDYLEHCQHLSQYF